MRELIKDSQHLIRAAALFVAGILVFLIVRAILVPADFGVLGHYRAGALDDARARPLVYAGRTACEGCHSDVVEARKGSRHNTVNCEACHGALEAHASDPGSVKPVKPSTATLCPVCHLKNVGKPQGFPQIDLKEHSGDDSCETCHKPHHPEIS